MNKRESVFKTEYPMDYTPSERERERERVVVFSKACPVPSIIPTQALGVVVK